MLGQATAPVAPPLPLHLPGVIEEQEEEDSDSYREGEEEGDGGDEEYYSAKDGTDDLVAEEVPRGGSNSMKKRGKSVGRKSRFSDEMKEVGWLLQVCSTW